MRNAHDQTSLCIKIAWSQCYENVSSLTQLSSNFKAHKFKNIKKFTFMSRKYFILSWVEHEIFITFGLDFTQLHCNLHVLFSDCIHYKSTCWYGLTSTTQTWFPAALTSTWYHFDAMYHLGWFLWQRNPGSEVIILISCSTQLSMKF